MSLELFRTKKHDGLEYVVAYASRGLHAKDTKKKM